jgi:hypothetical protein
MAHSPLLGGDPAPRVPGGRSTDVLGPSDTSDSGSDVIGADLGDADLDADSDAGGTGERAEAGRDTLRREAPDISTDQVVRVGAGSEEEAVDEPDALADMAADEDNEDAIDSDLDDGRRTERGGSPDDPVSERDKSIDA